MPSKKKSRKKARSRKSSVEQPVKVLLGALVLIGFLIVGLVLLSRLRDSLKTPLPPRKQAPVEAITPGPRLEDVRAAVKNALVQDGVSLEKLTPLSKGNLLRFDLRGAFPARQLLADLGRRLRRISPDLRLEVHRGEREISIFNKDAVLCLIVFQPPAAGEKPRLAIIVDDMGDNLAAAQQLLAIDLPVTLSVLPEERDSTQIATMAHARGHEVLIHIPMEPVAYPRISPGRNALYVTLTPDQIRRRFADYLKKVPYAVGGNNHMGSRFTQDRKGMRTVIASMKKAGLFFVDSLTTPHSVAFAVAREAGVPAAVRDRFLDNVQDVDQIDRQIRSLAELAIRQGHAIGICHPHPQTLEALRQEAPYLRQKEIEIVPVSDLLVGKTGGN